MVKCCRAFLFRTNVELVIGMATVRRQNANYLNATLMSLFENMDEDETQKYLVIVFVGDADDVIVEDTVATLNRTFGQQGRLFCE
jgi:hypothetical protein